MKTILLTFIFLCFGQTILSCDCLPGEIIESYQNAEIVVHGKVISIDTIPTLETYNDTSRILHDLNLMNGSIEVLRLPWTRKVKIQVIQNFKSGSEIDTLTIFTSYTSANCGFYFLLNSEYVIYGDYGGPALPLEYDKLSGEAYEANSYWTTLCDRTTSNVDSEIRQMKQEGLIK